jgi:hypothetical protein
MGIFSTPSAVSPKAQNASIERPNPISISLWNAFGLSFHQFLPVDLPVEPQWIPSTDPIEVKVWAGKVWSVWIRPSSYANFLRLAGWVLVPLGIAALTGLLRRVTP